MLGVRDVLRFRGPEVRGTLEVMRVLDVTDE
jgi:hypothetical protein